MTKTCSDQCSSKSVTPESSKSDQSSQFESGYVTEFDVPKMDCTSEEQLIRMSLGGIGPSVGLEFDIPSRKVTVFHEDNLREIQENIESLGLGARLINSQRIKKDDFLNAIASVKAGDESEARVLKWLLVINGCMFVFELVAGYFAQSTSLIADSLDMFADAGVYGLSLYAVGRNAQLKLRAAHISGWLQVLLAVGALSEVIRRFIFGSEPVSELMVGIGGLALIANISCLVLLAGSKEKGVHMKASWIFSANDVIANIGVILAGFLVALTGSSYPDLLVGLLIGFIVMNGARRILNLKS